MCLVIGLFLGAIGVIIYENYFKINYIYNKFSKTQIPFTTKCTLGFYMLWKNIQLKDSSIGFLKKIKDSDNYYTTITDECGEKYTFFVKFNFSNENWLIRVHKDTPLYEEFKTEYINLKLPTGFQLPNLFSEGAFQYILTDDVTIQLNNEKEYKNYILKNEEKVEYDQPLN